MLQHVIELTRRNNILCRTVNQLQKKIRILLKTGETSYKKPALLSDKGKKVQNTLEDINLFQRAKFTTDSNYKSVTIKFLKGISQQPLRCFVKDLMLKIYDKKDLIGHSATGRKPRKRATGTVDQKKKAICQKGRQFIEGN